MLKGNNNLIKNITHGKCLFSPWVPGKAMLLLDRRDESGKIPNLSLKNTEFKGPLPFSAKKKKRVSYINIY